MQGAYKLFSDTIDALVAFEDCWASERKLELEGRLYGTTGSEIAARYRKAINSDKDRNEMHLKQLVSHQQAKAASVQYLAHCN